MDNQLKVAFPVPLFYCYASADERLQLPLEKHLSLLQRQGILAPWHPRQIRAGTNRKQAIDDALNKASLILLLISPDFIASDYCYSFEMMYAMERYQRGEARVIPVLLRPVSDWPTTPFGSLSPLPSNTKPVTQWSDRDIAFEEVAKGIKEVIRQWFSQKTMKEWLATCEELCNQHHLVDALWAVQQALHIDPNDIDANLRKAHILAQMGYYEEAVVTCNCLLDLSPDCMGAYEGKIRILIDEERYEEALEVCHRAQKRDSLFAAIPLLEAMILLYLERYNDALTASQRSIHLDADNAESYQTLSRILIKIDRLEDALHACVRAIDLDPDNPDHYHIQGRILMGLERSQAALRAYEELIDRDPHAAYAFYLKAKILLDLNRYEEAVVACEQALDPSLDLVFKTANGKADVYYTLVMALMYLHRWEEALPACSELVRLVPEKTYGYETKALILFDVGRSKEALEACEQAIQLGDLTMPMNTYWVLGEALYVFERYEEALAAYEQVLHLDPNHPSALKGKVKTLQVLAYAKTGNVQDARYSVPGDSLGSAPPSAKEQEREQLE